MRLRDRYLTELGIPPWVRRAPADADVAVPAPAPVPDSAVPDRARPDNAAASPGLSAPRVSVPEDVAERWRVVADAVSHCTRCALHRGRTRTVFGTGNQRARLLVIGEAPGAEEDRQGEPFVGRAGKLLNAMLSAIGLAREDVFIANILKCRPPGNRDPGAAEIETCTPYLREQIALVKPDVILAVGRIAAQWLLQTDSPVGRLRGRAHQFGNVGDAAGSDVTDAAGPSDHSPLPIPLVVSYHPAYLLRTPSAKARAWDDLKQVRRLLASSTLREHAS